MCVGGFGNGVFEVYANVYVCVIVCAAVTTQPGSQI